MKSCETAVYDRTVLPEVQVLLTPHQIQTGITQLEKMIENMEQTILEIMGEYSSKWKVSCSSQYLISLCVNKLEEEHNCFNFNCFNQN